MRAGSKGKSRGSKGRALIKRSSSGRSSLASQRLKGKVTKTSSPKKEKKAPKHSIGAFFYFISHERAMAKKQRIQLPPITEWTRAIAAKWRAMTPLEQSPFHEKAKHDKIRYTHELARFNARKLKSASNTNQQPQSGFLVFLEDFRKSNTGDPKDIVKTATVAWSKISKAKKRLYQKRACDVRS
ncbi:hypothetical protein NP493_885g01000 [Ridgeia piscesae]|uniref:HMG box domain-containing protein n=1 Tax=Ridgeia piscesae TaxID=27915 RepID=A0AAD9KL15_RIDPI|nr:hypothetical protein NP493_885g01000 [Ridgeia piscesae]